jgi:hypothetical protein
MHSIVIAALMTFVLLAPILMVAVLVSGVVRGPVGSAAPRALPTPEPAWAEPVDAAA